MFNVPRVLIAGLRGGSGKTLVTVGLVAAWRSEHRNVAVYKKGPDYIDSAWLAQAAGRPCRNLDLFLHAADTINESFAAGSAGMDAAIIEGNRGVFDGMDAVGSCSAAELAKLLDTPVILVVDATKSTRTVGAVVLGCQTLDPDLPLRGVILNRVGGARHERILRQVISSCCNLPVVGAVPHLPQDPFPERHLGLIPPEHTRRAGAIRQAAAIARRHLDLEAIYHLARTAPPLAFEPPPPMSATPAGGPRIGVAHDEAFTFYYPENLEALRAAGARLVDVSPLHDDRLPALDALYLGGGFPELAADRLARNTDFRASLRAAVLRGLPVYAECGGTVYLGARLLCADGSYPMAGVLPVDFAFGSQPQGHGYAVIETVRENPFFATGTLLRGHEFHYTYAAEYHGDVAFAWRVRRGHGFDGQHDGLSLHRVLATYTHLHALSARDWAPGLIAAARQYAALAATPAPAR